MAEDIREDTGVDAITFEEVENSILSMRNQKAAGLDGLNS